MLNTMPEDSETECGDTDSQRPGIRTCDQSSTSREIRNDPCCKSHESTFVGLSSATDKNDAFSCGNEEEKMKTRFSADECPRPEIGCSNIREYDYIGFSEAATGGNKSEDENCIKLGPKTKETELRLGLPEDDVLDGGADVAGSRRRPDAKSLTIEAAEQPRLDLSSVQRGKADEYGPQRDSILERESRYVNRQEISGYNSFALPKKGSDSVDEARQAKLDVSHIEPPNISSLKDLRLPLRPGAYDSRFIQSGEAQKYWLNSCNGREFSQVVQDYNYRAFHAASKGIASGAKRGFSDVVGVNLVHDSGFGLPELDSKLLSQAQPRPFMFPWAVPQQYGSANTWQINWEQKNKQNFQQYPQAIGPSGIPDEKTNNRFGEVAKSTANTQSVAKDSHESQRLPAAVAASEKIQTPAETERAPNQTGTPSRAPPVVGWPPIRSFRKNLASQPKVAAAPSCNPPPPAAEPVEKKINTMFVKVNVDGVPIGRKIDLKAYDSYEKLSVALDEMFRGSINALTSDASPLAENNNNNNQASLLNGRDYVFVYEDIEGDRMLVGDVPWEMFVNTVKRLRVMKSSDAGRLANRTQ